jgi:actin-like ATPase involved in cell morphogenesis
MLTELTLVAGDIYDRSVILTGGGALLVGLPQYLQSSSDSGCVAEDPRFHRSRSVSAREEPLLLLA